VVQGGDIKMKPVSSTMASLSLLAVLTVAAMGTAGPVAAARNSGAVFSVDRTRLHFGHAEVGFLSLADKLVTVTNETDATISLSGYVSDTFRFMYPESTCGGDLAAGASCVLRMAVTPVAAGRFSGTLTLFYWGPDDGEPHGYVYVKLAGHARGT
jgi:hypothetical protein